MSSIADLCEDLPIVAFAAGAVLLEEGTSTGRLYVLIDGAVEVLKGDFRINVVADRGAIFGDMSALLGIPHTATVRAVTACSAYVIERGDAFLQTHEEIAFQVAKLLAQRLQGVTGYLVDLRRRLHDRQDPSGQDHLGLVDEILETLVHGQLRTFTPSSDSEPDE